MGESRHKASALPLANQNAALDRSRKKVTWVAGECVGGGDAFYRDVLKLGCSAGHFPMSLTKWSQVGDNACGPAGTGVVVCWSIGWG